MNKECSKLFHTSPTRKSISLCRSLYNYLLYFFSPRTKNIKEMRFDIFLKKYAPNKNRFSKRPTLEGTKEDKQLNKYKAKQISIKLKESFQVHISQLDLI